MMSKQYSILNFFKEYGGWKRILLSFDFMISFIILIYLIVYVFIIAKFLGISTDAFMKSISEMTIGISTGIFAILFAAFAIIISLSDNRFVKFLHSQNVFNKILFPFWLTSMLFIISIAVTYFALLLFADIQKVLIILGAFFLVWGILSTVYLITDTVNFGRRRADYIEYEQEICDELEKDREKDE